MKLIRKLELEIKVALNYLNQPPKPMKNEQRDICLIGEDENVKKAAEYLNTSLLLIEEWRNNVGK